MSTSTRRRISQLNWQQAKRAAGLCTRCGKLPLFTRSYCVDCRDRKAALERMRRGSHTKGDRITKYVSKPGYAIHKAVVLRVAHACEQEKRTWNRMPFASQEALVIRVLQQLPTSEAIQWKTSFTVADISLPGRPVERGTEYVASAVHP